MSKAQRAGTHWYVVDKYSFSNGRSIIKSLCGDSRIAIHSYVIDRARLDGFGLVFDEVLSRCEDYEFIIRLVARHFPDMGLIETPICEYRIRMDGSNSVLDGHASPPTEVPPEWRDCIAIVDRRRHVVRWSVTVAELAELNLASIQKDAQLSQHQRANAEQALLTAQHQAMIEVQRTTIDAQTALLASYQQERGTRSYRAFRAMCAVSDLLPRPIRRGLFQLLRLGWRTLGCFVRL